MACALVPSLTAREDFTARTGSAVTLALRGPKTAKAEIVLVRYAQDAVDSTPPIQVTVKAGAKMLVVLVEASAPGALLQLLEVCDDEGRTQVVDRFHFDPMNPARGYIVRGVSA